MNTQLLSVPFRDTNLFLVNQGNEPYVPMRPIVEGMGLDWKSQHTKLNSARFATCVVEITTQLPGYTQSRAVTCLPLRKLPGWMCSIHPNKVRPELRERIRAYQNECDDALWAYWSSQRQSEPTPKHDRIVTDSAYRREVDTLMTTYLWEANRAMKQAGVSLPWPKFQDAQGAADGLLANILGCSRWIVDFDYQSKLRFTPVPRESMVIDPSNREQMQCVMEGHIPEEHLADLLKTGLDRLTQMVKRGEAEV